MHNNNFDFLRLLFASFVLITHAYMFTGISDCDWLCKLSNGQTYFTDIGVKGFFIISGYLVYQSALRSAGPRDYLWKRMLRIYPGLFVVLMLIVLLGPLVYNSTLPYWQNKAVWTYIPSNLSLYKKQTIIPGIFDQNPHNAVINGSLWTIAYEFFFYILLLSLFVIRKQQRWLSVFLVSFFIAMYMPLLIWGESLMRFGFILNLYQLLAFGAPFFAGALLAHVKLEALSKKLMWFCVSLALLIISFAIGWYVQLGYLLLPIVVLLFGIQSFPFIRHTGKWLGDISYGVYIYGCPVQQTLVHFFRPDYLTLMLLSIPVTFVLGWLSWHGIESKALQYKNKPWQWPFVRNKSNANAEG